MLRACLDDRPVLQAKRTGYTTYPQPSRKLHHYGTASPVARLLVAKLGRQPALLESMTLGMGVFEGTFRVLSSSITVFTS